jgi:hypothetical protein
MKLGYLEGSMKNDESEKETKKLTLFFETTRHFRLRYVCNYEWA